MNKHTPGPWLPGQSITAADPSRIPGSHERVTIAQRVNRPADQRLIAAAPDLLEALKVITFAAAAQRVTAEHFELARAAIAKATGEKI